MNKVISLIVLIVICTSFISKGEITKVQFSEVTLSLQKTFPKLNIIVNNPAAGADFWWNLDNKSASYSAGKDASGNPIHYIFYFGGLARMSEMTQEGAALILCHELGHGIAGAPFKKDSSSSVEGQADYYATNFCLSSVIEKLALSNESLPQDPLNVCDSDLCRHLFVGINSELAVINATNPNQTAQFHQADSTIVESVNTSPMFYPSNQCRLDTLIAGALGKDRPRCWWAPNSFISQVIDFNQSILN